MKTIFQIQSVDRGRCGDVERWSCDYLGGDPNFDTRAEAESAIESLVRLGGDWDRANLRVVEETAT